MSDDRQQDNERFKQALDEMFGPAASEPEHVAEPVLDPSPPVEPVSVSPPAPTLAGGTPMYQPSTSSAPVPKKRSRRRLAALGCAGAFGLLFLCLVVLAVIGFITGGDDEAAARDEPLTVVDSAVRPSYTAGPGGEMPAELVPVGTYVELSQEWRVAVIGVTPDATDLVMEENQFNEPPEDGRQFFVAMVSVENISNEPAYFPIDFLLRAVNASGDEYTTFDDYCGVVPDEFPYDDVPAGQEVSGNVCWSVAHEDAGSLVMYSDQFLDTYAEHYFSLRQ